MFDFLKSLKESQAPYTWFWKSFEKISGALCLILNKFEQIPEAYGVFGKFKTIPEFPWKKFERIAGISRIFFMKCERISGASSIWFLKKIEKISGFLSFVFENVLKNLGLNVWSLQKIERISDSLRLMLKKFEKISESLCLILKKFQGPVVYFLRNLKEFRGFPMFDLWKNLKESRAPYVIYIIKF